MGPIISIISGIYNCADTLPEAIESILNQTVLDWEWILCDDASTDDTYALAKQYADRYPEKMILLRNESNLGLNSTLNKCLGYARGKYIARMDGDDLCDPERFALELACLEENPDISMVSSDMALFDEQGTWGIIRYPEYPEKKDFLRGTPFCHASCMVRKEAYKLVGGYSVSKRLLRVEDYHLWIKMYARGLRGKNIRIPLYSMRDDREAAGRRKFRYRLNEVYVRCLAVRELKLPLYGYFAALRPILVGLFPSWLYQKLRRRRLRIERCHL